LRLEVEPVLQILEIVFLRNPLFWASTASSAISTSPEWCPFVPEPFMAAVLATVALLELLLVGVAATEGDAFSLECPLLMFTIERILSIFDTDCTVFFGGDFADFFGTAVLAKGGFGFVAVLATAAAAAVVFGFDGVATLASRRSTISSLDALEVVSFRCVFTAVTFALAMLLWTAAFFFLAEPTPLFTLL